MKNNQDAREFQEDLDQYKMPEALKQPKKGIYQVGYEASTGNDTSRGKDISKRSDLS